ncbi:secreted RxLR effector protein 161-like [Telopea speciosissima]|uniref:secreted RxLR effector protein 161-like n=1 Tax=Telopea speciosissima TaxID=54955 RepID=UPI001CC3A840|nr:secreted RxLR effector protein 161-like [Telopea speciosissima]
MLASKPVDTSMDPHYKLEIDDGEDLEDKHQYRRLVGKHIYMTVTRPNISFAVGVISHFMQSPKKPHWEVACRILRYLKGAQGKELIYKSHQRVDLIGFSDANWDGSIGDRRPTTGSCTFVGGNLVTWHSKKQSTVARSSVEAEYRAIEYRAMAHTPAELIWLKSLLQEL